MADRQIPWDELDSEQQELYLRLNRALFEDPNWEPPEGYTVLRITIPAETWDELFADDD